VSAPRYPSAEKAVDPDAFEEQVLDALKRLVEQQRSGFDRVEAALLRLRREGGCRPAAERDPAPP
jgi:hypothetical protein